MCMHACIWGLHSRFDWWEFCCFNVLAKMWPGVLGGILGVCPSPGYDPHPSLRSRRPS